MEQIIDYKIMTIIVGKLEIEKKEIFLHLHQKKWSHIYTYRSEKNEADYLLFPDVLNKYQHKEVQITKIPANFNPEEHISLIFSDENNTYQTENHKCKFIPLISRLN